MSEKVTEPMVKEIIRWERIDHSIMAVGMTLLLPFVGMLLSSVLYAPLRDVFRQRPDWAAWCFVMGALGFVLLELEGCVGKVIVARCRNYIGAIYLGEHHPRTWNEYAARVMPLSIGEFVKLLCDKDATTLLYHEMNDRGAFMLYLPPSNPRTGRRKRTIFTYSVPHDRPLSPFESSIIGTLRSAARPGAVQGPSVIESPWDVLRTDSLNATPMPLAESVAAGA